MIFLNAIAFVAVSQAATQAAPTPDVSKHVTYTTVAVPVAKALADLSQLSGISLRAGIPISGEPIILRLDDVPINTVLAKIASTFEAEWDRDKNGLILARPEGLVQRAQAALAAETAKTIAKEIEAKKKALAALPMWDSNVANKLANQLSDVQKQQDPRNWNQQSWQRQQAITNKLPSYRALARMMTLLDPVALAAVPVGERTVFSTRPTPMQRPLPREVAGALDTFTAEMSIWIDERKRVIPRDDNRGVYYGNGSDDVESMTTPTTVLLTAQKYPGMGSSSGVNLEMMIADAKGKVIGRANETLGMPDYEAFQKLNDKPTDEQPIKLSPESESIRTALSTAFDPMGTGKKKPLDSAIVQLLVNPESRDPLSFGASDVLTQISALRKKNLVAAPTDMMIAISMFPMPNNKLTPSMALRTLEFTGTQATFDDAWMTVKAADGAYSRSRLVSRVVLGRYLRSAQAHGQATLDDKAYYAANTVGEEYETLGPQLEQIVTRRSNNGMYYGSDWNATRLYGLMDSVQRAQLISSKKIAIALLDPKQLAVVVHMVYGSYPNLQLDYSSGKQIDNEFTSSFYNGLNREPTICLPNGIPRNAYLTGASSNSTIVSTQMQQNGNNFMGGQEMTADQLGWQMFAQAHQDLFPWMSDPNQQQKLDRFSFGTLTKIEIAFHFAPLIMQNAELRDSKLASDQTLTFDQLPDDFKKEVEKAIAQYKDQYKNTKPGQYTAPAQVGNNIPPTK